ncbi:MAG: DUF4406 domain-containing protein [Bacteroidetes bacterium]|nr:DUF4406 domain-containing protein [Bacteroidota bacterium]
MKKVIYIAGKVTGEDPGLCAAKFEAAEREIENAGFKAVNPIKEVGNPDENWKTAMRICISHLVACDGIYLLPDYSQSRGAMAEVLLCRALGMPEFCSPQALKDYYVEGKRSARKQDSFIDYVHATKRKSLTTINSFSLPLELRVAIEDLIIAYDQMEARMDN